MEALQPTKEKQGLSGLYDKGPSAWTPIPCPPLFLGHCSSRGSPKPKAQSAEHKGPFPTSSLTSPLSLLAMRVCVAGERVMCSGVKLRRAEKSEFEGRSHYFLISRLLYPHWNVSSIPAEPLSVLITHCCNPNLVTITGV